MEKMSWQDNTAEGSGAGWRGALSCRGSGRRRSIGSSWPRRTVLLDEEG
jgi:hypothetical protein